MTELVGRALQFHQPRPRRGAVTRRNSTFGAMKPTETARHARELRGPNVTRQRPPNRCPVDTLRQAVNRNSDGLGSGPLACTLDLVVE
jgi:hypothetical protein